MTTKIQVVFYSMYGHIYRMAEAIAEGAREVDEVEVTLLQVPELVPDEVLEKSGVKLARQAFAHIPMVTPEHLADADVRSNEKFPRSDREIMDERRPGWQSRQRIHQHGHSAWLASRKPH